MKRINFLLGVDLLLTVALLAMVATGIILHFALPPHSGQTFVLWGLNRHEWGEVHFWLAVTAVAIVILHLALHWAWLVTSVRRTFTGASSNPPSRRSRILAAVVTALLAGAVVGGFSWAATRFVQPRQTMHGHGLGPTWPGGASGRGFRGGAGGDPGAGWR